jgi:hypothetical protein
MTIADKLSELAEALKNPAMAALCREHADLVELLAERDARIAELEAKLAMAREAHERYWRTDGTGIEREVYDAVIAAVVMEDP